jgi:membrane protein
MSEVSPAADSGEGAGSDFPDPADEALPPTGGGPPPVTRSSGKSTLARMADVPLAVWDAAMGFGNPRVLIYASALSFDLIFAIVPFLVLSVTALKWLGTYRAIKSRFIEPWLHHMFRLQPESGEHMATLRDAFIQVLDLVEHANIGGLGIIGLVATLYLIWAVVRTIEFALNAIFEVEQPRGVGHALRDYSVVLFIVPVCFGLIGILLVGLGYAQDPGPILETVVEVNSIAVGCLGVAVLYVIMPNTRVPLFSALLGAAVAAALGYLAFALQVYAQIGVFRYNALYSGFAFVPLFLLWVFLSWLSVLFGAEVAAAHMRRRSGGNKGASDPGTSDASPKAEV